MLTRFPFSFFRLHYAPQPGEPAAGGAAVEPEAADPQAGEDGGEADTGKAAGAKAKSAGKPAEDKSKPAKRGANGRFEKPALPSPEQDNQAFFALLDKMEENEGYEATPEELALYERVNDRPEGLPERPKPGKKAAKPAKKEEVEEDPEDALEEEDKSKEEAPAEDEEEEAEDVPTPKALKALVGDKSPIGAKTLAELPAKVQGLVDELKKAQGMGGEVDKLTKRVGNQLDFIKRFIAGDAQAIAFATQHFGYKAPAGAQQGRPGAQGGKKPVFLDDEMAAYVQNLERTVANLQGEFSKVKTRYEEDEQASAMRESQNAIINEMSTLVEKYPALRPKDGSIREMMEAYFKDPGQAPEKVDPRIAPLVKILTIAANDELPSLQHAYATWALEQHPQSLAEAERRGRQSLASQPPSRGLSDRQGSQGGQYQAYTDEDFTAMAEGRMEMPEDWINQDTGQIIPQRLPKRLRDKFKAELAAMEEM